MNSIPIDEARKLSPIECYSNLKKTTSKSLDDKIKKFINQGNRIFKITYANPLMKYHQVIAYIHYINIYGNIENEQLLDDVQHC